jgi:hypothetical protein
MYAMLSVDQAATWWQPIERSLRAAKRETDLANRCRDRPKHRYLLGDVCSLSG